MSHYIYFAEGKEGGKKVTFNSHFFLVKLLKTNIFPKHCQDSDFGLSR